MLRYLFQFTGGGGWITSGVALLLLVFQIWMLVDAIRRREYLWAFIILIGSGISALIYYFLVYRASGGPGNPLAGFELPGAADRRRIKDLQASIHHLDKAHHHLQLGDIYFSQGKLDQAEASYRAAWERDPQDEDVRAHLGTCWSGAGRGTEALPLLESVCAQNPKHDYGLYPHDPGGNAGRLRPGGAGPGHLAAGARPLLLRAGPGSSTRRCSSSGRNSTRPAGFCGKSSRTRPTSPASSAKRERVWLDRAKSLLHSVGG